MATILALEDNDGDRYLIEAVLQHQGLEVKIQFLGTLKEGLHLLKSVHPDLILLDQMLPDTSDIGSSLLQVRNVAPKVPVIVMSSAPDMFKAMSFGAHAVIDKVSFFEKLVPTLRKFLPSP